jgi:hypothetical protein
LRRRGREAEGGGLLNRYTVKSRIEGSNPSVSASTLFAAVRCHPKITKPGKVGTFVWTHSRPTGPPLPERDGRARYQGCSLSWHDKTPPIRLGVLAVLA